MLLHLLCTLKMKRIKQSKYCDLIMDRLKILILAMVIAFPTLIYAKDKTIIISVTSEPTGAKVYVDGKLIGTTPCKAEFTGKWVYDIDADRVNPNKPPYSKKFTFVKEGYKTATEYWEGTYEYHEAGIGQYRQKYYIVKPNGYGVMTVLKRDPSYTQVQAQSQQSSISKNADLVMKCNIDSEPDEARVFWRVISQDSNVRNTEAQYLGKTPFKGEKAFKISGLSGKNSNNVKIEITIKKNGYYDVTKIYSVADLLEIMEINGFFEMESRTEG